MVNVLLTIAALALAVATALGGQSAGRQTGASLPTWTTAWSPLANVGDQPRSLDRAPELTDLIGRPALEIGMLWTAGTPGAAAVEIGEPFTRLDVRIGGHEGSYRRTLDPDDVRVTQLVGEGWRPLGGRGAAFGAIAFDEERAAFASHSDFMSPHGSDPLILVDTTLPRIRRFRARLEGGLGWRFGSWGAGIAAGVETRRATTSESRFARLGRSSTPGLTVAVSRGLPLAGLRIGVHGRWTGGSESVLLGANPGSSLAYVLAGYSEPDPISIQPPSAFFRRVERNATAAGIAAVGTILNTPWAVFVERMRRRHDHFSVRAPEPPTDRWEARGWVYGGALQWQLVDGRILVTARGRYSHLEGDVTRADLPGVVYRATEGVLHTSLEARYAPDTSSWWLAGRLTLSREDYLRRDFVALVRSDIGAWTPGAAIEFARWFLNTAVSAGFSGGMYSPVAVIPDPSAMGPLYRLFHAREQALYATPAVTGTGMITVRRNLGRRQALLVQAHGKVSCARGESARIAFAPGGRQTVWTFAVGLVIDR